MRLLGSLDALYSGYDGSTGGRRCRFMVIDGFIDFTTNEPAKVAGQVWVNQRNGFGSISGETVTRNNIYIAMSSLAQWYELVPEEGVAVFDRNNAIFAIFDGSSWQPFTGYNNEVTQTTSDDLYGQIVDPGNVLAVNNSNGAVWYNDNSLFDTWFLLPETAKYVINGGGTLPRAGYVIIDNGSATYNLPSAMGSYAILEVYNGGSGPQTILPQAGEGINGRPSIILEQYQHAFFIDNSASGWSADYHAASPSSPSWIADSAFDLKADTTNPTFDPSLVRRLNWRVVHGVLEMNFYLTTSGSGSAGSGSYYIDIPSPYRAVGIYPLTGSLNATPIGFGNITTVNGSAFEMGNVVCFVEGTNIIRLYADRITVDGTTHTLNGYVAISDTWFPASRSNYRLYLNIRVPVERS